MKPIFSRRAILAGIPLVLARTVPVRAAARLKVAMFSKHLQFLQGDELAKTIAEMGYDAVDLTVRKGGHVEPDRVRQDLPPLVAVIRKHGLELAMITTDIVDAATPHTEEILKTMQELGIRHYRFGGFSYSPKEPYARQLDGFRPRLAKLAELNARYKTTAMYHTHSGKNVVGASIWDLYLLMKDLDPAAVGVNYDVAHATIEGGGGGWINSFRITEPHLRGIAVKDFVWSKDARGNWHDEWTPLGEGMVHFAEFFPMVAECGFSGPLQVHFEYDLGGANAGRTQITIPREQVLSAMKRDLAVLRGHLAKAGL